MTKEVDPLFVLFSEAHALYPGRKRFVNTEFKNLKEKHKDYKEVLPLLKAAIEAQIKWRERKFVANEFTPEWKQFANWAEGRDWEYDYSIPVEKPKEHVPYV